MGKSKYKVERPVQLQGKVTSHYRSNSDNLWYSILIIDIIVIILFNNKNCTEAVGKLQVTMAFIAKC